MIVVPQSKRKSVQQFYFKNVMERSKLMKEMSKKLSHPKIPKHEKLMLTAPASTEESCVAKVCKKLFRRA